MSFFLDTTALKKYPKFRWIYFGQFASRFGSMMTNVAIPYQVYQLTKSTFLTGLVGVVMLIPNVAGGLFGGSIADSYDRRKLILLFEGCMTFVMLVMAALAYFRFESAGAILLFSFVLSLFGGFHRPALEALTPRLVAREDLHSLATLNSLKGNVAMIAGPATAGILLTQFNVASVYVIDGFTFLISIFCVLKAGALPTLESPTKFSWQSIQEGLLYAKSRQELAGTYIIDIIAMAFSMPHLLFPAVAEHFGHKEGLGWLHSSLAIGAFIATIFSGWTKHRVRHGLIITLAAASWCVAMICFGFSPNMWWALTFILIAGYCDMISAIFRTRVWNETIPDNIRGRMAGLEMISYMSGPLIGNAQLGFMAQKLGIMPAISMSSFVGLVGIAVAILFLPKLWLYNSTKFIFPSPLLEPYQKQPSET